MTNVLLGYTYLASIMIWALTVMKILPFQGLTSKTNVRTLVALAVFDSLFIAAPIVSRGFVLGPCLVAQWPFLFCNHLDEEEGASCFTCIIWALTGENLSPVVCQQLRHRPVYAFMQPDQHLCYSLIGE